MPYRIAVPYRTAPYLNIPFCTDKALPYYTILYRSLPCHGALCHARRTIPFRSISRHSRSQSISLLSSIPSCPPSTCPRSCGWRPNRQSSVPYAFNWKSRLASASDARTCPQLKQGIGSARQFSRQVLPSTCGLRKYACWCGCPADLRCEWH